MKKASRFFPLICSALFFSGCGDISKDDFVSRLFPNVWDALATFLAFIVLLLIAFYLAYKPVKNLLKKRGDYVETKIKNADEKEKQANTKLLEAEQKVKDSNLEAIDVIEKAKEDALKEKERIAEEAKQVRLNEVEKAKQQIAQEVEASKDEIHKEIVNVALDASSKILSREVIDQFRQILQQRRGYGIDPFERWICRDEDHAPFSAFHASDRGRSIRIFPKDLCSGKRFDLHSGFPGHIAFDEKI